MMQPVSLSPIPNAPVHKEIDQRPCTHSCSSCLLRKHTGPLGIMGAMTEEVGQLVTALTNAQVISHGNRDYHCGTLWGRDVIIVFSHWGKVSAAMTATSLITEFGVDSLVFTGVAGGVDPSLRAGDIVVATSLVQHDMDARPLFSHHEIPLLNRTFIESDPNLRRTLVAACQDYIGAFTTDQTENLKSFGIIKPRIVEGVIASGDKFFASKEALNELRSQLPEAICVEMEGAAVAQVCSEYGIPYAVVRTISDSANDDAVVDFVSFIQSIASAYSFGIMQQFLTMELASPKPCMGRRLSSLSSQYIG